jgi:double zinc ribbon protein
VVVSCESCGAEVDPDARFCQACGARLHECPNCGFVNRAGGGYCAKCGRSLVPESPEPVITELLPAPRRPARKPLVLGALALLFAVAALVVAFVGLGSPDRSGNIPAGALAVAGVDPTAGKVVRLDLSKPIKVAGTLPAVAAGVDTVRLSFVAADIELGTASVPLVAGPDGRFVTYFRTTGGRYLVTGRATGEITLLAGASNRARQFFTVRSDQWSIATIPAVVTIFSLYSLLARITWLLRSLRRGRRRRSGPVRMAFLGALGGVALVLVAWIAGGTEPLVATAGVAALLGACAGLTAALGAVAVGEDRVARLAKLRTGAESARISTAAVPTDQI